MQREGFGRMNGAGVRRVPRTTKTHAKSTNSETTELSYQLRQGADGTHPPSTGCRRPMSRSRPHRSSHLSRQTRKRTATTRAHAHTCGSMQFDTSLHRMCALQHAAQTAAAIIAHHEIGCPVLDAAMWGRVSRVHRKHKREIPPSLAHTEGDVRLLARE
jgi:hypothetical protein